jgi:hypothetical protein
MIKIIYLIFQLAVAASIPLGLLWIAVKISDKTNKL